MISKCPECLQSVGLPTTAELAVDPDAEVICPLCGARFPLEATLSENPPELVLAETTDSADGGTPRESTGVENDSARDEKPCAEPENIDGNQGHSRFEAHDESDHPQPFQTAAYEPNTPDSVDASTIPAIQTGREPLGDATFDFHPSGAEEDSDESAADVATRLRRSAGKKGIVREMIGVFFGGIAGLAIAYYALNFFWGQRFDVLSVYLPGCPHTYRHWPDTLLEDWIGDSESTPADSSN